MSDIAFLGPPGTFTEQATRALTGSEAELVPYETVPQALAAVRAGTVRAAGVPVENSVEGSVPATLDALTTGDPLVAVRETLLPVQFDLLVRPGTTLADINTVASHPHALAQVRGWLADTLPKAETHVTSSTAAGAAAVADGEFDAAISAAVARAHYPVEPLVSGIADVQDAVTRFLLVRRPGEPPAPTGADRTSICAVICDEVGSLVQMLAELSLRGINLSRIESRPLKDRIGGYRFFLDFDGHVSDPHVGDALSALHRLCTEVRFLGSYPKADRKPVEVPPSKSAAAFGTSARWLAEVRAGRLA